MAAPRRAFLSVLETKEAIVFDALVDSTHTNTAEVTDLPIEVGADVSDHIRRKPDTLSVSVIISNHPPLVLASLSAEPISGYSDPTTRAENAHEFLRNVMQNNQLVSFSTTLRFYNTLAITSMSVDRNAETGNMVRINLEMREIIIATTETVDPPLPVKEGRKRKNDLGKKTKSTTTAPVEASAQTTSRSFFTSLIGG